MENNSPSFLRKHAKENKSLIHGLREQQDLTFSRAIEKKVPKVQAIENFPVELPFFALKSENRCLLLKNRNYGKKREEHETAIYITTAIIEKLPAKTEKVSVEKSERQVNSTNL